VDVIPLVRDVGRRYEPGWCTYNSTLLDFPEAEVCCGGINSKTPKAAAVWRQGNLLHFGFEPSAADLNETGQALLVNAVVYISRFRDDRPIALTPSPFAGVSWYPRSGIDGRLGHKDAGASYWEHYFAKDAVAGVNTKDPDACRAWYKKVRGFLHAAKDGKLTIDPEAQAFGVSPNTPEFFEKACAAQREGGEAAARARRLLGRYAPEGPGPDASAEAWREWSQKNRAYLFFSDMGGYRWYVDPLAQKRGVPTAELRGPARADRPLGGR
jgi:hypothetical protein